jgi:hypothetical protein
MGTGPVKNGKAGSKSGFEVPGQVGSTGEGGRGPEWAREEEKGG